jgi:signal transduction histidine kinase
MRFAAWLRRHPLDVFVVVLAAVQQLEAWVGSVPGGSVAVSVATLLWTLPLLLRRRFPFAAPAFAFGVQIASSFLDPTAFAGEDTGFAAVLVTFWVAGANNERAQAVALTAIGFAAIAVVERRDVRIDTDEAIAAMVAGGVVALVAFVLERRGRRSAALEARAARLAHDREAEARAAVAAERARIGRDLQDVVARSVDAMTEHARTARRALVDEDPARAREPIPALEQTGRQALAELRRLLGILHPGRDEVILAPQPGMEDLDGLLERARTAGLPVALTVEGPPAALAPGLDLAAYRVVQDALTNALEHARPAHARVAVRYRRDVLDLEVSDDGGDGRDGLVGLRERVALYGGEIEAGREAGGDYAVRVRLPLEMSAP